MFASGTSPWALLLALNVRSAIRRLVIPQRHRQRTRSPCPRWSDRLAHITDRRRVVHRTHRQHKRVGRTGRPVTHGERNRRTPTLIARRGHRHRPTRPAATQHNVRVRHQPLGTAARTQCQIIRVRIPQRHRQRTRRRVLVGRPGWLTSLIVGASFTAFTVNTNVSVELAVPSLTVSVIVALPFWLLAGVTVTVRLAPLPPSTMFASGTNPWCYCCSHSLSDPPRPSPHPPTSPPTHWSPRPRWSTGCSHH